MIQTIFFILAAVCEVGGTYLIWLWLKEGKSLWLTLLGALILVFVVCLLDFSWHLCQGICSIPGSVYPYLLALGLSIQALNSE